MRFVGGSKPALIAVFEGARGTQMPTFDTCEFNVFLIIRENYICKIFEFRPNLRADNLEHFYGVIS